VALGYETGRERGKIIIFGCMQGLGGMVEPNGSFMVEVYCWIDLLRW